MDLEVFYKMLPLTSIIMNSPISRFITLAIILIILLVFGSVFNILNLDNSNIKESSNIIIENEVLTLNIVEDIYPDNTNGATKFSRYDSPDFQTHYFGGDYYIGDTGIYLSGSWGGCSGSFTFFWDISIPTKYNPSTTLTFYFLDGTTKSYTFTGAYNCINDNSITNKPLDKIEIDTYSSESRGNDNDFYITIKPIEEGIISSQGYLIFNDIILNETDKTPEDFDYCILTSDTTNKEYLTFSIDQNLIKLNEVFENPKLNDKNIIENLRIDLERVDEETSPTLTNLNLECSANKNDLKISDDDDDSSSTSETSITLSSYSSNSYGNGYGFWANYGLTFKNWFNSFTSWVKSFFVPEVIY